MLAGGESCEEAVEEGGSEEGMGKIVEEVVELGLLEGSYGGVDKDGFKSSDDRLERKEMSEESWSWELALTSFADSPARPNFRGKALKISGEM